MNRTNSKQTSKWIIDELVSSSSQTILSHCRLQTYANFHILSLQIPSMHRDSIKTLHGLGPHRVCLLLPAGCCFAASVHTQSGSHPSTSTTSRSPLPKERYPISRGKPMPRWENHSKKQINARSLARSIGNQKDPEIGNPQETTKGRQETIHLGA